MGDQLVGGGQNNQDMPSDGQYINFNFSWYFVGIDNVFVSGTSGVARRSAGSQATPQVRGCASNHGSESMSESTLLSTCDDF